MVRPPFHLIPHESPGDVVEHLEELLEDARNGKLIGVAYAAMYRNREYFVDAAGECRRNPTWARGIVDDLWEALGQLPK